MFKYIKYTKVKTEDTTHEFRAKDETVTVHYFDTNVVSLEADDEADIDALINAQHSAIECVELTHDAFKQSVTSSSQLARIREVVRTKISERYTLADEIALNKRADDDAKKVAYIEYVNECIAIGIGLKMEVGY